MFRLHEQALGSDMALVTKTSELSAAQTEDSLLQLKLAAKRAVAREKQEGVERAKERRAKINEYMDNLKALTNKDNKSLFKDMVRTQCLVLHMHSLSLSLSFICFVIGEPVG